MRQDLRAALALTALAATASPAQETRTVPAFPARADAITADVVVLDKDGRPVRGLTQADFTLLEDGKSQAIVAFEARELATGAVMPEAAVGDERVATSEGGASHGRTFAFLIDDLGTRSLAMEDAKKAIVRWLREKADPRDEVTLATGSGDVWWSDRIDRGRTDLEAVLSRVKPGKLRDHPWISDWEAYRIVVYEDATGAAEASAGSARVAVGPPGGPPLPNPDANPDMLGRLMDRVVERTGMRPAEVRMRSSERYNDLNRRTRALLGATERLSRGLTGARGRKSILVFSEGFLYDPNQRALFDRSIDASQRANTAIYFVDIKGLEAPSWFRAEQASAPNAADLGVRSMEENVLETSGTEHVAENTGGASVRNTNDLFGGLTRVTEESSTYYLLGYQPEKSPDGKWHKLEVKVARPGVRVRTRHGYQATPAPGLGSAPLPTKGKSSAADDHKPQRRPLDPAVMTSGAADALPCRLAPYVLDADKTGLVRVLVVLELDTSSLALRGEGGRRTGAVDLTLLGMSRDQPKTFPLDERVRIDIDAKAAGGWMTLSRELRLPAGVAQVRALVRDVGSGLGGTVTQRLEVPPLDAPYLGTPIVTDKMLVPRGSGARLMPVAHRRFRTRGYLFCSYEVFGMTNARGEATTQVAGGYTLQAEGGRVVSAAPPTPIAVDLGGRVVRLLALPLAGLEKGNYELTLEVVDKASGRTLVTHEAFALD